MPALAALLAPAAAGAAAPPTVVPAGAIRPPVATGNMDTNPANLASAVLTHAFGQLPRYIDGASFRLLPLDVFRAFTPRRTSVRTYRLVVPRTGIVLDTVYASGPTTTAALQDARQYRIAVSLDGRRVPAIGRYWVSYRNDGPQICRIYFPGDLSSLQMRVNSLVLRPLAAGRHVLTVLVVDRPRGVAPARIRTRYLLRVLDRGPDARERAIAPADDAPKPSDGTPLLLRPGR